MNTNKHITLSYIVTTFNKLPYLKITLPYLIEACKEDEEIILVDGGSSDGTKEYLQELYHQKKIHQFLSEKDFGEAHGFNKGIFLAKGELIKPITDDDLFNYKTLGEIKTSMLNDTGIDIVLSDVLETTVKHFPQNWLLTNERIKYKHYKTENKSVDFIGLSMMVRKTSFAKVGIFNTTVKCVDSEFTLRFSSLPLNILFIEKPTAYRLENENSNLYTTSTERILNERDRINYLYNKDYYNLKNSFSFHLKQVVKALFPLFNKKPKPSNTYSTTTNLNEIYLSMHHQLNN